MYKNYDSIFVLPIPEEKFANMKVIGKNIEFELVTKSKNVLFFKIFKLNMQKDKQLGLRTDRTIRPAQ